MYEPLYEPPPVSSIPAWIARLYPPFVQQSPSSQGQPQHRRTRHRRMCPVVRLPLVETRNRQRPPANVMAVLSTAAAGDLCRFNAPLAYPSFPSTATNRPPPYSTDIFVRPSDENRRSTSAPFLRWVTCPVRPVVLRRREKRDRRHHDA